MQQSSPSLVIFVVILVFFSSISIASLMASAEDNKQPPATTATGGGAATTHIVYLEQPEGENTEAFHLRTLASVVGSEEAAKEALLYSYKHAANGFSAKLTPQQAEQLSKQPGVLQVVPSQTFQLHGAGAQPNTAGLL